jgi:hypothetical protein
VNTPRLVLLPHHRTLRHVGMRTCSFRLRGSLRASSRTVVGFVHGSRVFG